MKPGVSIAFYDGDPLATGSLLGVVRTTTGLVPGHYEDVTFTLPAGSQVTDVYVVADDLGHLRGELTEDDELNNFARTPSPNRAPLVSAGTNHNVLIATPSLLTAKLSDDGLPAPARLSVTWSQLSGPGTATFSNPADPLSNVTFPVPGVYVLQAAASDGQLASTATVQITAVDPASNHPPRVNAGPDATVTPGADTPLLGQIEDDGLPFGTITSHWEVVSGPGTVTFADATAAVTTAQFSEVGAYVLRLAADDGQLSSSAEMLVSVYAVLGTGGNQAPAISAGEASGIVGHPIPLYGAVSDDGLPTWGTLEWRWQVVSGPGPAHIADPTALWTEVVFDKPGEYSLALRVSDGELSGSWLVPVSVAPAPNAPPVIAAIPNVNLTLPNRTVSLSAVITDDGLPSGKPVRVQWSTFPGAAGVPVFSAPTSATTNVTFDAPGPYFGQVVADDTELASEPRMVLVTVEAQFGDQSPPTVALTGLDDVPTVTKPTPVVGSVAAGSVSVAWRLERREAGSGGDWTLLAHGLTPVTNQTLATFDPTLLLNGTYDLRLTAIGADGLVAEVTRSVIVDGNFKVGQFSLTFVDAEVQVAGMPIQVIRTYDSRDQRKGDFGFGWTLDVTRVRVHESGVLGRAFTVQAQGTQVCIVPNRRSIVTATTPDGKVHKFEVVVEDGCAPFVAPDFVTLGYRPLPGTTAQLTSDGISDVLVVRDGGDVELVDALGQALDPRAYQLTLLDGRVLAFDQFDGFQSITDLNGNVLSFATNGISHSSGKRVAFTPGLAGIAEVTTPDGVSRHYGYDVDGNLASYTDGDGNVTRFAYHQAHRHHLLEVIDPRGVRALRNDYDDDGRLVSTTDGLGKTLSYVHDIDDRRESIVDRNGNTRLLEYDERGNVTRETDQEGKVTTRTFDANDNRLTETDPTARTRTWVYDAHNLVLQETDPAGHPTTNTYDATGRLLTTTDPLGHTWTSTYDLRGNLLTQTGPIAGQVTTNEYDFQGNLFRTTGPTGAVTSYEYDSFGNRTKETDANGHETAFTYDDSGRVLTETRTQTTASGTRSLVTAHTYDGNGREASTTDASGATTRTGYDYAGKQAWTMDALGRTTTYTYDAAGRLA